jgi:very-short-patch-repair endonuclease
MSSPLALARHRQPRRNSTDAEGVLWSRLRAHRFGDLKFRRQHSCGPYILDFFCPEANLAVELDGGQHFDLAAQAYDARRTSYLVSRGIVVLRFPTDLVFREIDGVLNVIAAALGVDGWRDVAERLPGDAVDVAGEGAAGLELDADLAAGGARGDGDVDDVP